MMQLPPLKLLPTLSSYGILRSPIPNPQMLDIKVPSSFHWKGERGGLHRGTTKLQEVTDIQVTLDQLRG